MTVHRTFGRRSLGHGTCDRSTDGRSSGTAPPVRAAAIVPDENPAAPAPAPQWSSRDQELAAWKQARRQMPIPWRQLSMMAGLCFGVASLVLPDSVNGAVDWLLYALMAASFYAAWRKRRPSA